MRARLSGVMRQFLQVCVLCLEGGTAVGVVYGGVIGVLLGSLTAPGPDLLPGLGVLLLSGCLGALLGAAAGAFLGALAGCVTGGMVVGVEMLIGSDGPPGAAVSRPGPTEVVPAGHPPGRGDEVSPSG